MNAAAADASTVIARCREVARISDVPMGTTRTFLSPAMRRANDTVAEWMRQAALAPSMDAAGNLRGRRGAAPGEKTLILASHLDTVPNAGAFDGVLGVTLALAVADALQDDALPFALEVIAFSEEEGVRFGEPFIGSRALVGTMDEALLAHGDRDGVTVRQAIQAYGLDPTQLPRAILDEPLGYLEFHLEQGPMLEHEGLPLAVVESISGQSRYALTFTGEANHAGTTPMNLRHDAMAAAAQWIAEVERTANAIPGLVATVGSVQTLPGAGNVIAGEVHATLDVRSANDLSRADAVRHLLAFADTCSNTRGVRVRHTRRMEQAAVRMDAALIRILEDAVDGTGTLVRRINSGAGHDAMIVAPHMPAAMLFLRTPRGLSHHPEEDVLPGDVQLALEVGVAFVRALAAQHGGASA